MARCSSKLEELRKINSIGSRARNITIYKGMKAVMLIIKFISNNNLKNEQMQVQKGDLKTLKHFIKPDQTVVIPPLNKNGQIYKKEKGKTNIINKKS